MKKQRFVRSAIALACASFFLPMSATQAATMGTFSVPANLESGTNFIVPNGATSCTFTATGTWSHDGGFSYYGADGFTQYNGGSSQLMYPGILGALVAAATNNGTYIHIGASKTLLNISGQTLQFAMNDTHGGFYNNFGNLSVSYSCNGGSPTLPTCTLTPTPSSITAGQTTTLTASCSPAATSYQWSDTACASTSATCTVSPSATTNYTVKGVNAGGVGGAAAVDVVVGSVKAGEGLAYLTLGTTKSLSTDIFNNWGPEESGLSDDFPTHLLYSPEDYSTSRSTETNSTDLPITKKTIKPLGGRIPIILVHGWQGVAGKTKPQSQMTKELSADNYWNNLIQFFQNNATLKSKYKLYVYKYPSYKHVTYNAIQLKKLLDAIPDLKNAQQMSFIGHSMGTIVVRSLFEEHDFDHSRVQKIIMLDGVHHGSPAAVPGLVYLDTNGVAEKDLYTLGSNDIQ